METHSSHMNLEPEGAEREKQERAIIAQRKADLEYLRNNVHPSLRDSITLGDESDGTCGSVSDYAALILRQEIELLKEANQGLRDSVVCLSSELATLKQNFETLRLQTVHDATPESSAEVFADVPGIGAKAEEFAPANASAPMPTETPAEAPKVQQ